MDYDYSTQERFVKLIQKEKKTKEENEELYFLQKKLFAQHLIKNNTIEKNPAKNYKERILQGTFLTILNYGNCTSLSAAREYLDNEICSLLNVDAEDIYEMLYEIKYLAEYDTVLMSLYFFLTGDSKISSLKHRDTKKEYEKKRTFYKEKANTLKFLKQNGLPCDDIEKADYIAKDKHYYNVNRESTIKGAKANLFKILTTSNKTGKERAKIIIKLYNHI